jgi:tricorn protease
MHGYDWEALRQRYNQLLPYVAHRTDLNYVISEMISELTVQHAYIDGGDVQIPPRPHAGLPGARFEVDAQSGRYRIATIFRGQNEEDVYRSPLTEIGVDGPRWAIMCSPSMAKMLPPRKTSISSCATPAMRR